MKLWNAMALASALALGACGDKGDDTGASDDTGAGESDTDTDTDADADADTDADADADTDTDTDADVGCQDALADNTACVFYEGADIAMPQASAFIGTGSAAGLLRITGSQDGALGPPAMVIDVPIETTAGTVSCGDSPNIVTFTTADGTYMGADSNLAYYDATCTITFTAVGGEVGNAVEGSFVSEMYEYSSASLFSVSGTFKTSVAF